MRALAILTVSLFSLSASAFEGEIKAEVKQGGKGKSSVEWNTFHSKKGDVRMDVTGRDKKGKPHRTSMIMPANAKYFYMEDHDKKTVMKMENRPWENPNYNPVKGQKKKNDKVSIKKLGKETVAGQSTQHVRVTDEDGTVSDLWISEKYPYDLWVKAFTAGQQQSAPDAHSKERMEVMKKHGIKPGLVMKAVTKEKGNTTTFQVLGLREGKVASTRFKPNPKYKSEEVPAMPQGFKAPSNAEEAKKLREEMMKKYGR